MNMNWIYPELDLSMKSERRYFCIEKFSVNKTPYKQSNPN